MKGKLINSAYIFNPHNFFSLTFFAHGILLIWYNRKKCGNVHFWSADKNFFLSPKVKTHFLFPKFNKRVNVFWNCWNCNSIFFAFVRQRYSLFSWICVCLSIWYCDMFLVNFMQNWKQVRDQSHSFISMCVALASVAVRSPRYYQSQRTMAEKQ